MLTATQTTIQFTNWLVAILTPILLEKSAFGAYFIFGGLAMGTVAVLTVYMPETRGRSLENIQEAFHQPTLKTLKGFLRRFKSTPRRQLQHMERSSGGSAVELDSRVAAESAETSSIQTATRGLRLEVSSAQCDDNQSQEYTLWLRVSLFGLLVTLTAFWCSTCIRVFFFCLISGDEI